MRLNSRLAYVSLVSDNSHKFDTPGEGIMLINKNKYQRRFFAFLLLLSAFFLFSCNDLVALLNYAELEENVTQYTEPVENLEIRPGEMKGEVVLSWTHLLGTQVDYELYYSDQPISEENWGKFDVIEIDKKDIIAQEENGSYRMEYTWQSVPLRQKTWIVVRQSLVGLDDFIGYSGMAKAILEYKNLDQFWMMPPSLLPTSNMLSLVDTGFRPETDGFQFKNRKVVGLYFPDSKNHTIQELRTVQEHFIAASRLMFGDDDVCVGFDKQGQCDERESAEDWAEIQVKEDGGQCSGFTTTAGRFFLNEEETPKDYGSSRDTTYGIPEKSDVFYQIIAYQYLQKLPNIKKTANDSEKLDKADFIKKLESLMLSSYQTPNLAVKDYYEIRGRCSGHSVLPYLLIQNEMRNTNIWVYDNNFPFSEKEPEKSLNKVVEIDVDNNHWHYEIFDNVTWDDKSPFLKNCSAISVSNIADYGSVNKGDYYGKAPWHLKGKIFFLFGSSIFTNVQDSSGAMLGYVSADEFVNDIPGAIYDVINEEGTAVLILPEDDYVIEVVAAASADAGFLVTGGEQTFSVSSVVENDKFTLTGESVTYQNASTTSKPEISISLEADDHSSNMTLQPITATSGVEIQYDPVTLDYSISAAEDFSYQLDLSYISENGESNLQTNTIQHQADDSDTFNLFEVEDENDALQVEIDSNNDGNPDQTIEAENIYQPPEEKEQQPERSMAWKKWLPYIGGGFGVLVLGAVAFVLIRRGQEKKRRRSSYGGYRPGSFDPSRRKPPASGRRPNYPPRSGGKKPADRHGKRPPSRYDR